MPKEWRLIDVDLKAARRIVKSHDLTLPIAKLLASRGLTKPKDIKSWFEPDLADLHKPAGLTGTGRATKMILEAIKAGERIAVFGDFDVDGIASTALLTTVLRKLGADVTPIIPNRFGGGYGLNADAVRAVAEGGAKTLITVDCGVGNVDEIALAKELGLKTIIVDHHEPPAELPAADVIINPRRPGCVYPFKDLAGVGLAFKLAQVLADAVDRPQVALEQLDLVALGTVADLAPLVGENRILVCHGLARIESNPRPGLTALRQVSGLNHGPLTATQISFALAPRLNASGRLASAETAFDLLITEDAGEAHRLAKELDDRNRERQKIEQKMFAEAVKMIETQGFENSLVFASKDWHEGVKGIVASRLVERYFRPTIMFSVRDGLCMGSGRSIPGFNLYEALEACKELLVRWGGHQAAAGLVVREEDFPKFKAAFERVAADRLKAAPATEYLTIDLELEPGDVDDRLSDELARLGPYGAGNPMPTMAMSRVFIDGRQTMGAAREHLRFLLQAEAFVGEGVAFKVAKGSVLLDEARPVDVAFHLSRRAFNGTVGVQLKVVDARPSAVAQVPFDKESSIMAPEPGSGFLLPAELPPPGNRQDVAFVDLRGLEGRDDRLIELLSLGLSTAVYVRDEHEGVQLANRLAKLNGNPGAKVTVTCQAPRNAGRLVIYQAPLSPWAMRALCAMGPDGPGKKLVYLLFDQDDVSKAERTMDSLCPDRRRLADIYRLLREYGPFDIDEAAGVCRRRLGSEIYQPATRYLAALAIQILAELKLVAKTDDGKLIVVGSDIKAKLEVSPSWRRAELLKREASRFAAVAMTTPPRRFCQ